MLLQTKLKFELTKLIKLDFIEFHKYFVLAFKENPSAKVLQKIGAPIKY